MKIGNYNPLEIEPEILKYWDESGIYPKKIKDKAEGKKSYYFLDGPPYTSGKVHIGTAWNKSLKDMVLRYKWMKGFDVWDRAGYDMHGLPTEHATEKKLGLNGKPDIIKFGVNKFIAECKKLCVENMKVMNQDFKRLGSWMDYENAYQSITKEYIEGEWWLIKKAHEKGRLYEGKRTMHWCADCATALAKHELEYQEITDDSVFLKFKVADKNTGKSKISSTTKSGDEYLIVWTTTPWTIPFNMGVMVNPELDYVRAQVDGEVWILSKGLAAPVVQSVAEKSLKIIEEFKGSELEGLKYEHPLKNEIDFEKVRAKCRNKDKIHTVVLSTEYVDLSAGTGLVHMAPGCGPEDYEVGHREGIYPFNNLDEGGYFPKDMGKYSGWKARTDDKKFIEDFKEKGCLIAVTPVEHDYAFCQRCHNPIIYRATVQWFFKVEDLIPKMLKENESIKWVPQTANNAFVSWLTNLRDNSITKQRFWGTPLPVWKCRKCGKYDVVGNLEELRKLSGQDPEDLHKPYIDAITIPCECGGEKTRIPDILDVWVDAGTASWNCLDYPKNKLLFEKLFPADFILEGKDQIRGWFNLLMVASMIAFDKTSFKAVYMHGFTQDAQGRKMSKSLGNYILPEEVIDKYGADTFRFFSIGGANPGIDIMYNFEDMKVKHRHLMVLWNVHKYLIDLGKEAGITPKNIDEELVKDIYGFEEKYITSKMNSAIKKATLLFEGYRLNEVPSVVEELFLELSRTYIQLIRDKLVNGSGEEKQAIFFCIYDVLINSLKLFAPTCPFITEKIYLNLREAFDYSKWPESIHLHDWPKADDKWINKDLEESMAVVQNIIQSVLAGREKAQLGLRWPLKEITLETTNEEVINAVEELGDLLKTQVNCKETRILEKFTKAKQNVKADFAKIGPEFGNKSPKIIAAIATTSPETVLKHLEKDGFYKVDVEGEKIKVLKEHLIIDTEVPYPYLASEFRGGIVYLNRERSEKLEAEGYSREIMRRVQSLRKKEGLEKSDRIILHIKVDDELKSMIDGFNDAIKEKVGADKIVIAETAAARKHSVVDLFKVKDKEIEISFDKV